MMRKRLCAYLPIIFGSVSALIVGFLVPTDLSVEVYRWVYSTIIQAYAAMVALVCMFTIYRLQLLRRTLETDVQELMLAVAKLNNEKARFNGLLAAPVKTSSGFIDDKKVQQQIMKVIKRDRKWIENIQKEIHKRGKHEPSKDGRSKWWKPASKDDAEQLAKLDSIKIALQKVEHQVRKKETREGSMMEIRKTIRVPLVTSGFLIGISLLLLSFSEESIINAAPFIFSWLFAGIIGTAISVTYMLIREILTLIEA